MKTFDRIVLVMKPEMDTVSRRVCELIKKYGEKNGIPTSYYVPRDRTEKILLISIGGDGTMLGAMRTTLKFSNATILGLNTGTLGFLSEELPMDIERYLDKILNFKDVEIDRRMVAKATIYVNGEALKKQPKAINEFIITGGSISDPVMTEVFINEHFVSKQLGNGVLVATATGSTAMSLSAGGTIVSPSTNIMQIVPLMAHTLTSRPIISTGRDTITVKTQLTDRIKKITIHADGRELVSYDGTCDVKIEVVIERYLDDIKIWRPEGWNFFDVLAKKMKW